MGNQDAQIMSWILEYVDSQFILHLRPYKTAQAMWNYLKQIYCHENFARRFQLKYEICQCSPESLSAIQSIHKSSCRDQFLMKLQLEFETARSNLMSWVPSPSLEACLIQRMRPIQCWVPFAWMQNFSVWVTVMGPP